PVRDASGPPGVEGAARPHSLPGLTRALHSIGVGSNAPRRYATPSCGPDAWSPCKRAAVEQRRGEHVGLQWGASHTSTGKIHASTTFQQFPPAGFSAIPLRPRRSAPPGRRELSRRRRAPGRRRRFVATLVPCEQVGSRVRREEPLLRDGTRIPPALRTWKGNP